MPVRLPYCLDPVIEAYTAAVEAHRLAPGVYCRFRDKREKNAYGCADAANILYTVNRFPKYEEHPVWIRSLQELQDQDTGLFPEGSHAVLHTTAHVIGALNLFDALPSYSLTECRQYLEPGKLAELLSEYNAHKGAGIYAALVNAGEDTAEFRDAYFGWLDSHSDRERGIWQDPQIPDLPTDRCVGDTFHYLFNYLYARRPFPSPERLIDTCLTAYENGRFSAGFGKQCHFIEMDWVFDLNRASRQTSYRFDDIRAALYDFAGTYLDYVTTIDFEHDRTARDLHLLFGSTCCLAELQTALPGMLPSSRPLRPVLDRRPFI